MAQDKSMNPDPAYNPSRTSSSVPTSGSFTSSSMASSPPVSSSMTADTDDVIDTLNDLLESCRDGEYGFTTSAEHAKSPEIKSALTRHAQECRAGGLELQTLIRQLGGESDDGGSVSGALHRGWVAVRGTLSGYSDQAMLDECERGEDAAVARYRKALKEKLPDSIRSVVQRQAEGVQRNHDQVKAMRDAYKSSH
jgi:uncharacterized protein (TIGR02284 family)